MSIRALIALSILTIAVAGCKSGDTAASTTPAAPAKTADSKAPAADTTTTGGATADASNPLVGTWEGNKNGMPLTYEFTPDNKVTVSADMKSEAKKLDVTIKMEGTYKVDGDKFLLHFESQNVTANNEESKAGADAGNKQPLQPDEGGTFKTDGKDKLIFAGPTGAPLELTRKA
jgi:hypothetical protein